MPLPYYIIGYATGRPDTVTGGYQWWDFRRDPCERRDLASTNGGSANGFQPIEFWTPPLTPSAGMNDGPTTNAQTTGIPFGRGNLVYGFKTTQTFVNVYSPQMATGPVNGISFVLPDTINANAYMTLGTTGPNAAPTDVRLMLSELYGRTITIQKELTRTGTITRIYVDSDYAYSVDFGIVSSIYLAGLQAAAGPEVPVFTCFTLYDSIVKPTGIQAYNAYMAPADVQPPPINGDWFPYKGKINFNSVP